MGSLAATVALTACEETTRATVTHIVDGDTIDVEHDGEERRLRLLNVDTPESTDPDVEPECLGPEATEFLASLVPVGTEVTLETDEELQDQYGRFLAGVYVDDALVNAEIARAGLGVAVLFEPNSRFYDEVLAAQEEARAAERGLYDPVIECTVPAQVAAITDPGGGTGAAAPAGGASLETLEGYAEEVATALVAALALEELLDGDRSRLPLAAFTSVDIDDMRRSVASTATELDEMAQDARRAVDVEEARIAAEEEARRLAEEEVRRAAEEEARRAAQEAERRAAEEEARRVAEQAEREAAERRAQERQQQGAQRAEQPRRSTGSSGSSGSSGGYDGYTGCRAYGGNYAPNATDEQGRPYTKIDCTTKLPIG